MYNLAGSFQGLSVPPSEFNSDDVRLCLKVSFALPIKVDQKEACGMKSTKMIAGLG